LFLGGKFSWKEDFFFFLHFLQTALPAGRFVVRLFNIKPRGQTVCSLTKDKEKLSKPHSGRNNFEKTNHLKKRDVGV
jgi:hypothetical protein